jgi:hypothetical protein
MSSSPAFDVCFLDDGHSDWCEVEAQCRCDLHFLLTKTVEDFFMDLLGACISSLENCSTHLSILWVVS